ncbi:MAG: DUF3419 family protein [archaeon]|nr:DUF3419 family protein [archaeon]
MNEKLMRLKQKNLIMSSSSPMYLNATEMTSSYYDFLNLSKKDVLTIIGSGDQVIDAYFYGAKKVVGFDINKNAIHMINLKLEAIRLLSYKEFLMFFYYTKLKSTLNYQVYLRLRKFLSGSTRIFFDKLYKLFNFDGYKVASSCFIHQRRIGIEKIKVSGFLKNEKNYNKVKKIMFKKKPLLLICRLTKLGKRLGNLRFDFINLSNVPNYLVNSFKKKDPLDYFFKKVLLSLKKVLRKDGKIIYYNYDHRLVYSIMNLKKSWDKLQKYPDFEYSFFDFKSANNLFREGIRILKN